MDIKKEIIPGKVDRKKWIMGCVEYFKIRFPEHYQKYVEQNKATRESRSDDYGTMKGDKDMRQFREGIMIPQLLWELINTPMPDPTDDMKEKPVITPSFLQGGFGTGTPEYKFAQKELKWFRETYPEFATSHKY